MNIFKINPLELSYEYSYTNTYIYIARPENFHIFGQSAITYFLSLT